VALRVNGQVISEQAILAELKRLLDFYSVHMTREELGRQMETLLQRAREHAIGTSLLIEEVRRRHIAVPDADVEAALQEMVRRAGGEEPFEGVLAKQQLTRDQLRQTIRVGKQLDRLVARVTAGVDECAEEEMRTYFAEHAERYASADQAQVRHILVKPASDRAEDRAAARSRLLALKRQAEEGEDFAELAAACSECPSGRKVGGMLGWISRGSAVPQFDRVIFDMAVGEISDVIETPLGYHIVEKLDEAAGEPPTFEQVRDRIRELLMHERRGAALSRFVDKLRETAVIEEDDGGVSDRDWARVFDAFLDAAKGN
jgi:parvulin-like peptidyl-prolyl isomerase